MALIISHITGEDYEVVLARFRQSDAGGARYNIAPSQQNVVVAPLDAGAPAAGTMRWGNFVSFGPGSRPTFLINARSETARQKKTFSDAIRTRRCLVPADGFYEWKRDEKGRSLQAYYFQRKEGAAYWMAGLYWQEDPEQPRRYIVLTTAPNELLEPIHDRMPVMLTEDDARRWVDQATPEENALALCRTFPAAEMQAHPVSDFVNKPANEGPACIEPVEPKARPVQGELF